MDDDFDRIVLPRFTVGEASLTDCRQKLAELVATIQNRNLEGSTDGTGNNVSTEKRATRPGIAPESDNERHSDNCGGLQPRSFTVNGKPDRPAKSTYGTVGDTSTGIVGAGGTSAGSTGASTASEREGSDVCSTGNTYCSAVAAETAGAADYREKASRDQTLIDMIDAAAEQTDTQPTVGQIEAGNYAKGKVTLHGLSISIENPKGSTRSGTDKNGKPWSITMRSHYGYFLGSEGKDGDHVDCFIGPDPESEIVYVVNQVKPDSGRFDEHKVMLGWYTEEKAVAGYLANYEKGWKGLGSVCPMTIEQFKWWLAQGNTTTTCDRNKWAVKKAEEHVPTVAVDLDGTLAQELPKHDPDRIGDPRSGARKWMKALKSLGARLIIWTVRGDKELVTKWLTMHDIPFDFINENPDQPEDGSDKIIADVYVDDRAIPADQAWKKIYEKTQQRLSS